jgi:hypothetical protein
MALTDAWTNKDALAFTSGILTTIALCVAEVESKLKRGTLTETTTPTATQVQNWLIRAKEELVEVKLYTWRRKYVTLTATAGTYIYGLPTDYAGKCGELRDVTNDKTLNIISPYQFDKLFPNVSEMTGGSSIVACIKNNELWLAPPPSTDVFEFEIYRTGDAEGGDFDYMPEIDRFRCCDFALAECFEALHDYDKVAYYRSKWERGLGKSKIADGKKKWTTMGYRARSVFQA